MIKESIISSYSKKTKTPLGKSRELYKKLEAFFSEVISSKKPIFPKIEIDEPWHHFILNTKEYQNYCFSTFGKFIHHTPMKTPKGFADCSADCYGDEGDSPNE